MSLVGRPAPDFELEGYLNRQFSKYKLSDYRKKWVILLFYPLDFTFVCPTEVLNFSAASGNLGKLNCQVFGISVDSIYVHKAWVETKREDGGLGGSLGYPLLSDLNKGVARDYGILMENEGKVFSHRELVLLVQGYDTSQREAPEILRPLVSRLRHKLEQFPVLAEKVSSVRGTGYVYEGER